MYIKRSFYALVSLLVSLNIATLIAWAWTYEGGISGATAITMVACIMASGVFILSLVIGFTYSLNSLVESHRSVGVTLANLLEKSDEGAQAFICDQIVREARHHPRVYVEILKKISRQKYRALIAHCDTLRKIEWESGITKYSHPKGADVLCLGAQLEQLDQLIVMLQEDEPGAHKHTQNTLQPA